MNTNQFKNLPAQEDIEKWYRNPVQKIDLVKSGNCYQVIGSRFEDKWLLKGASLLVYPGFRWNPDARYWYTENPKAAKLLEDCYSLAKKIIAVRDEVKKEVETSRACDQNIVIPAPANLEYRPFQKAGISYATNHPQCIIADEMGLGKTIQALGVINVLSLKKVLVVCPKSVVLNWRNEAQKWIVDKVSIPIYLSDSISSFLKDSKGILILNYNQAVKYQLELRSIKFDLMVADEAHYLKTPDSQRTQAVLSIKSERTIFLTGTPIPNRPKELWPMLEYLGFGGSFFGFAKRYCAAYQQPIRVKKKDGTVYSRMTWNFDGASNLDELQTILRTKFLIRRLKKDVLKELPPIQRQTIFLESDKEIDSLIEKENEMESRSSNGEKVAFEDIARVRRELGIAKIPQAIEHLQYIDKKTVVFCHHHEVMDGILKEFPNAVKIDGRDSNDNRMKAMNRFQNSSFEECPFIFCGIQAAGIGITLTAADQVLFVEQDWTPGNIAQAEARVHRIGQESSSILISFLVFEKSLDSRMSILLVSKTEVSNQALDDSLKVEKEAKTVEVIPESRLEKSNSEVSKNNFESPKKENSDLAIAVKQALKIIDDNCDGARREDLCGFNKFDTSFGHSLANCPRQLSEKQISAGLRLVNKYKRQVPQEILIACGIE